MKQLVTIAQIVFTLASVATAGIETGAAAETVSTGTAFRVSPRGHLLTNYHVVEGCRSAVVYMPPDGFRLGDPSAAAITMTLQLFLGPEATKAEPKNARILKTDPQNDLALLIPQDIDATGAAKP